MARVFSGVVTTPATLVSTKVSSTKTGATSPLHRWEWNREETKEPQKISETPLVEEG